MTSSKNTSSISVGRPQGGCCAPSLGAWFGFGSSADIVVEAKKKDGPLPGMEQPPAKTDQPGTPVGESLKLKLPSQKTPILKSRSPYLAHIPAIDLPSPSPIVKGVPGPGHQVKRDTMGSNVSPHIQKCDFTPNREWTTQVDNACARAMKLFTSGDWEPYNDGKKVQNVECWTKEDPNSHFKMMKFKGQVPKIYAGTLAQIICDDEIMFNTAGVNPSEPKLASHVETVQVIHDCARVTYIEEIYGICFTNRDAVFIQAIADAEHYGGSDFASQFLVLEAACDHVDKPIKASPVRRKRFMAYLLGQLQEGGEAQDHVEMTMVVADIDLGIPSSIVPTIENSVIKDIALSYNFRSKWLDTKAAITAVERLNRNQQIVDVAAE